MQQNYFQLLGVTPSYFLNMEQLAENYRNLQRRFHPDRYVSAPAQEKRIALQYATLINEAYQCLVSPVARAQYLLELAGCPQQEHTMQPDHVFLLQQMEWREQLEMAGDSARLAYLQEQTGQVFRSLQQEFADAFADQNYSAAQHIVDKMHFVSKFEQEVQDRMGGLAEG